MTARRTWPHTLPTIGLALLLVAVSFALPATAGTKDRLDAAKAELASIQADLDEATAEWQASLTRLDATNVDIANTQLRIHGLEDRIATIERA